MPLARPTPRRPHNRGNSERYRRVGCSTVDPAPGNPAALEARLFSLPGNDAALAGRMTLEEETEMAIDPVCGMRVDEKSALHKSEYDGQTYYFCASSCKRSFDREPQKFIGRDGPPKGHTHHV
jgi:YHS domain-containing protein